MDGLAVRCLGMQRDPMPTHPRLCFEQKNIYVYMPIKWIIRIKIVSWGCYKNIVAVCSVETGIADKYGVLYGDRVHNSFVMASMPVHVGLERG